jgi:glutaredoxin
MTYTTPARNGFIAKILCLFFILSLFSFGQAQAAPAEKTVVLYGTSWCIYCKQTRAYFKEHGIEFTDYDVENPTVQEKFKALGGAQVPLIFIGDEKIQGFNQEAIDKALAKAGIQKKN